MNGFLKLSVDAKLFRLRRTTFTEEWTAQSCLSVRTKKLWTVKLYSDETSNNVKLAVLYFVHCTKAVGTQ